MNNTWLLIFFGVTTVYFGREVLQVMPTVFRLLAALRSGAVKWPGPRIHDPGNNASIAKERLGIGYQDLFSTFFLGTAGGMGGFIVSLSMFMSGTPLMRDSILIDWTWPTVLVLLAAFVGGRMGIKKAQRNMVQVNSLLSNIAQGIEPRTVDSQSARSEYAIEHPLIRDKNLPSDRRRALDQFYASIRYQQDGNEFRALALYNEATRTDPSLHENAREALSDMAQDCSSTDAGAIYYWLGIHSEWLSDLRQAAVFYEKAVNVFDQIGYKKRASRACNNLGSVKMQMRDPSAMEEFEKAIALDPANGMAHISVGVTYYRISERGDPRFEQALDAFAEAIAIDSLAYTSVVTSHLCSISYTWKEDLKDVLQRADRKMLATDSETDKTKDADELKIRQTDAPHKTELQTDALVEDTSKWKTYRDPKHGFEIDIPENWEIHQESVPASALASVFSGLRCGHGSDVDVVFTNGPDEIMNFLVETMNSEPTPSFTERLFRAQAQHTMNYTHCEYGRIIVGNKAHAWARYLFSNKLWSKKYMIVLDGKGYAITVSHNDDREAFLQREKVWDAIAASLRVPPSV